MAMKNLKGQTYDPQRAFFRITKPIQLNNTRSPMTIKKIESPTPSQQSSKKSLVHEYFEYLNALEKGESRSSSRARTRQVRLYRPVAETTSEQAPTTYEVNKNHFSFHYVVGAGGFGKVWKVEYRKTRVLYAMKEMSKAKVITKRSVSSVMNERELLCTLKHPFLVNMVFAFQDRENLYLVMDLMSGGDLRYHIGRMRRFTEKQTCKITIDWQLKKRQIVFFVACMIMGLEYLHTNEIIHRDMKPENLVLDMRGYVRITDLGIARKCKPDNASDTSGTPGYMAPEVMCHQNHGIAVDYFAVGVMAFEFMFGKRPYQGKSRKEIRDHVLSKQVQIRKSDIPEGWSLEAADFINKMIQRKPQNRLGFNGPEEVKAHPWVADFPWNALMRKEIESPFIPSSNQDNFDSKQQIVTPEDTADLIKQNALLLRRNSVQNLFNGYLFDNTSKQVKENSIDHRKNSINTSTLNTNGTLTASTNFTQRSNL